MERNEALEAEHAHEEAKAMAGKRAGYLTIPARVG
jgi:hypothetical protein